MCELVVIFHTAGGHADDTFYTATKLMHCLLLYC